MRCSLELRFLASSMMLVLWHVSNCSLGCGQSLQAKDVETRTEAAAKANKSELVTKPRPVVPAIQRADAGSIFMAAQKWSARNIWRTQRSCSTSLSSERESI